jgi:hypothetical protein
MSEKYLPPADPVRCFFLTSPFIEPGKKGECTMMRDFDPFKPVFAILCSRNNSDLLQEAVNASGLDVKWPRLDDRSNNSHRERIRAFKQPIYDTYEVLGDEKKGPVAQNMVKYLWSRPSLDIKQDLRDMLSGIAWTITDDGNLLTQDALISEQFFPAGTQYDAYVAIREILAQARMSITLIDAYIGSALFETLAAVRPSGISVQLLTTAKNNQTRPSLGSIEFPISIRSPSRDSHNIRPPRPFYHH